MKHHLHFNCFSGAAGDMILSALVDLGADAGKIDHAFQALGIGVERIGFSDVLRGGIRGRFLSIEESGCGHDTATAAVHSSDRQNAGGVPAHHQFSPDHRHHNHEHHDHHHGHDHACGPHRHLSDMLNIVERIDTEPQVKQRAKAALHLLAEAESRIHGTLPDKVHFHELSGIDTIVDVLGSFQALEILDVDSISASRVTVGRGTVRCAHGLFTVPAPATLAILADAGIPYEQGEWDGEFLTPTGAALLAVMVDDFGPSPAMRPERIGYGAGTKHSDGQVNLLQAILGVYE